MWCALIHLKYSSQCAYSYYNTIMSLEWCKSFGFTKFDKVMLEEENSKGYKEANSNCICLNVGKLCTFMICIL